VGKALAKPRVPVGTSISPDGEDPRTPLLFYRLSPDRLPPFFQSFSLSGPSGAATPSLPRSCLSLQLWKTLAFTFFSDGLCTLSQVRLLAKRYLGGPLGNIFFCEAGLMLSPPPRGRRCFFTAMVVRHLFFPFRLQLFSFSPSLLFFFPFPFFLHVNSYLFASLSSKWTFVLSCFSCAVISGDLFS